MTTVDWSAVRELFSAAQKYVYLATAGAAALSTRAAQAGIRYYQEMLAEGDAPWDRWLAEVEMVRGKTARFIGAAPEEVAFTYSASHGMNLVAQMLSRRGEVLTITDEFPASTLPWLQQRSRVRFITSGPSGVLPVSEVERALSADTRVVVTSSIQYATGFRQDLHALGALCADRNITLAVDASQSVGAVPIDVHACQSGALVFSGYKWTMAGYGIAVLYLNARLVRSDTFPIAGWLSAREPEQLVNDRLDLKDTATGLEVGCPHFAGIFALGAAIDLLSEIGADRIEARIHELTDHLHTALRARQLEIASPTRRDQRAGITIVAVKHAGAIVDALARRLILTSARGRGVRVSLHIFNTFEDIDRLVDALAGIIDGL